MAIINMVKTIKKIYPSCVVLVKIGNFYHVYGKDAYILAYLFEYKIIEKSEVPSCGFPINALGKGEAFLEKSKINYIVVDRRNNYEEEEKYINKQENKYEKFFKKSEKIINNLIRIQKISKTLLDNKEEEEILKKVEKVIEDEKRKI